MGNDLEILGRDSDEQEMMGWEEIVGAALASSGVKSSSAFNQALAARMAKRSATVQNVKPTKKRRYHIGFGPTAVPPTSTVTVQVQPQCLFRGEKLVNTGDTTGTGGGLFIQGIFVGNKSQLPTFQNGVSVITYDKGTLDNELLLDTCQPALFITFQIQNTASVTLTWSMTAIGHAVL